MAKIDLKNEQLEVLASLYGEDVSTYKDMQDMDYLLKKIGYNDNPEKSCPFTPPIYKDILGCCFYDNTKNCLSI